MQIPENKFIQMRHKKKGPTYLLVIYLLVACGAGEESGGESGQWAAAEGRSSGGRSSGPLLIEANREASPPWSLGRKSVLVVRGTILWPTSRWAHYTRLQEEDFLRHAWCGRYVVRYRYILDKGWDILVFYSCVVWERNYLSKNYSNLEQLKGRWFFENSFFS